MLNNQLQFSDHSYSLMTAESEQFGGILEQYAGVFSEHMKQQLQSELSIFLASSTQAAVYKLFKHIQTNNRVGASDENNIFQNKQLTKLCFVEGYQDGEAKEPGALSIELAGLFHRIRNERFLEKEDSLAK